MITTESVWAFDERQKKNHTDDENRTRAQNMQWEARDSFLLRIEEDILVLNPPP